MRLAMMTREYPPDVYGGAGVHVTELVAQLRRLCMVDVHCMGAPRPGAIAHEPDPRLLDANAALSTLSADLVMAEAAAQATVVHSHTWYSGMAGHLTAMLYDIPHILTAHSLEPLRPWKAEQLGGGYRVSTWVERTAVLAADAVIAVSAGMREDVLRVYPTLDPSQVHVVRNGVDSDVWFPAGPAQTGSVLAELGVDPNRPMVAFVGRITRQKGVGHLVAAAHQFSPDVQLVLCAGAPDTPEIADEVRTAVEELARTRTGVFWIREMLPVGELREILSAATVFVCSSVYEPLGIVNLEAMACATAVVASDVGGIPEVVVDGVTGSLVHYDADDPIGYQTGLAKAVNELVADPAKAERYGGAGRGRCIEEFSWAHVAEQTLEIYRKVCS
ncbi:glycogen synthase [Mycobacterium montefiorense]|uniref:Glycosyl transferase family 1 n=1 Tax=Mycobacterium montefiorense TaxID=154654 RepID=A0AA37PKN7_9MYCO|nr:glycogen synthase [Mycobacterium montefiorense]GBG37545.1 glycosyl transferase family 1 [Mycobacterium montefiorense]GKU36146.1 glycosyl transferase family 1 [Mycobacterium montefiorense]GKU41636.1 glycosyl transferase family 1 [Mycobacterium montefiorense]GKU47364.1 glycosyl transferase family 1 [Mycobacterium montefiorense]GKU48778.1 glycosyl transferase family 1 [Mycobacterium montefiorense]